MRDLDEVLKELKEAEKEYHEKCLKYGIEEKVKRKPKVEETNANPDASKEEVNNNDSTATTEVNTNENAQDKQ